MNELSIGFLLLAIFALILMSAFFSCSETAMMALNRYRLRHLVNEGHRGASRANLLLQRPDRLLGVILMGNNLVIFVAASFATVVGQRLLGDNFGPPVSAVLLALLVLIFAEVMPKTVAAQRPETLAFPSSYILQPLLKVSQPVVVFINVIANCLAAPMIARAKNQTDDLSADELRTVVNERTSLPRERQDMLLGILDLENATIDDIMVPRSGVAGIDIEDDATEIVDANPWLGAHAPAGVPREHQRRRGHIALAPRGAVPPPGGVHQGPIWCKRRKSRTSCQKARRCTPSWCISRGNASGSAW